MVNSVFICISRFNISPMHYPLYLIMIFQIYFLNAFCNVFLSEVLKNVLKREDCMTHFSERCLKTQYVSSNDLILFVRANLESHGS